MPTAYINNQPVELSEGDRLNCVQLADRAGQFIPHYCYHEELSVVASCRMCLVEIGELKDGKVMMVPKVFPGCQTPVKDNSVIITADYEEHADKYDPLPYPDGYKPAIKATKAQEDTLEGLLLNHPLDCPVCDKAGECKLQDFSYDYGRSESRMVDKKNTPPNKPHISSKITLFTDRCIMCTRCVRFAKEVAGTGELIVTGRGHHEEIDVFPGRPLENKLSGNVVDLCPVGALGSKDFLYSQRVWHLREKSSICSGCATGCTVDTDVNKDRVYRVRPRLDENHEGHFICDDGRYGYHYHYSNRRIYKPTQKDGSTISANNAVDAFLPEFVKEYAQAGNHAILVLSPFLTVEEAYLLAKAFRGINSECQVVLGPIPVDGEDDHYPKAVRGVADKVRFTIRAEKAPNRLGVSQVCRLFQKELISLENFSVNNQSVIYYAGGYPVTDHVQEALGKLAQAKELVAHDLFTTQATQSAYLVLPATSSFEKFGTYIRHDGKPSHLNQAIRPAVPTLTEYQIAYKLLKLDLIPKLKSIHDMILSDHPELGDYLAQLPTSKPRTSLELV